MKNMLIAIGLTAAISVTAAFAGHQVHQAREANSALEGLAAAEARFEESVSRSTSKFGDAVARLDGALERLGKTVRK